MVQRARALHVRAITGGEDKAAVSLPDALHPWKQ